MRKINLSTPLLHTSHFHHGMGTRLLLTKSSKAGLGKLARSIYCVICHMSMLKAPVDLAVEMGAQVECPGDSFCVSVCAKGSQRRRRVIGHCVDRSRSSFDPDPEARRSRQGSPRSFVSRDRCNIFLIYPVPTRIHNQDRRVQVMQIGRAREAD